MNEKLDKRKNNRISPAAAAKGTRARNNPQRLTEKERRFVREYVKTGNGTQSALAAGYNTNAKGASVIASSNLAKLRIREEVAKVMAENDIELHNVLAIHKRNLEQDKHLPTSQKAVNDYYELVGLKEQKSENSVNIAFVVEK